MRDIERILEAVREHPYISPVHKQILINRIEPHPTHEEIERAKEQIGYGRMGARRSRNTHCSNCGDTRGGPVGHEISECTWEADRG